MTTYIFKTAAFSLETREFSDIQEYIDGFFSLVPEGVNISKDNLSDVLSPRAFLGEIFSSLSGSTPKIISFLCFLLASVVVTYLASPQGLLAKGSSASTISLILSIPILEVLAEMAISLIDSLREIVLFFSSVIPIVSLIDLASGAPTASKTQAVQMTLMSALINHLSIDILAPIAVAMLAFGATASLEGGFSSSLLASAKSVFTKILAFITATVGILFSLQSVIATAADSAAIRLAKFSAQSMLPQIGGLVSSSLSALGAGLSYAKGIIGAGAIYVILVIFLSPLPVILAYRICLSLAESFARGLGVSSAAASLSGFLCALDSLLSIYTLSTLLSILELLLFIRNAVPIV